MQRINVTELSDNNVIVTETFDNSSQDTKEIQGKCFDTQREMQFELIEFELQKHVFHLSC